MLGERHGRPVSLWSIRPYGDPRLDTRRRPWNAVGDADATEIKDRIAASEEQTEPYYAASPPAGCSPRRASCSTRRAWRGSTRSPVPSRTR